MKVKIEIDCETSGELLQHLGDITTKIQELESAGEEFEDHRLIVNNNCYGSHEVEILPDEE